MKVCDQANGVNDTKLMQVGMSTLSMDTNSSCKHGVWVKKKTINNSVYVKGDIDGEEFDLYGFIDFFFLNWNIMVCLRKYLYFIINGLIQKEIEAQRFIHNTIMCKLR